MSAPPPTDRAAWLLRCVQRLARHYRGGVVLPGGDRGMIWSEYTRLLELIMAEYRED